MKFEFKFICLLNTKVHVRKNIPLKYTTLIETFFNVVRTLNETHVSKFSHCIQCSMCGIPH